MDCLHASLKRRNVDCIFSCVLTRIPGLPRCILRAFGGRGRVVRHSINIEVITLTVSFLALLWANVIVLTFPDAVHCRYCERSYVSMCDRCDHAQSALLQGRAGRHVGESDRASSLASARSSLGRLERRNRSDNLGKYLMQDK